MFLDLFTKKNQRYASQLERSRASHELAGFASWLRAAHYTPTVIRRHLWQLHRSLMTVPRMTPRPRYSCAQLQRVFTATHGPWRKSRCRATRNAYQRYLAFEGRLHLSAPADRFATLRRQYDRQLQEMRGFAYTTLRHHRATVADFLKRGVGRRRRLRALTHREIERYIALKSKENTRHSLQHVIAALRAFLRYCREHGKIRAPLDQIDTPRVYRHELPPRALDWSSVQKLLRSINRRSKTGERDYAILHLMAHYGLRPAEIVSLQLGAINWDAGTLRVEQRKTRSELILPLAADTQTTLRRYLTRTRGTRMHPHSELFLSASCPFGPLARTTIGYVFSNRAIEAGLDARKYSAYSLRHGLAMRLLDRGVGVKAIGDVLGHRNLESTCVYLRLDFKALREVALPVPRRFSKTGGRHE